MNRKRNILILAFVVAVMLGSDRSAKADFTFGTPTNLGPVVNSAYEDCAPCISSDGLSLYFSDHQRFPIRPGGYGGADLWVTRRETIDDEWSTAVNVGRPVNSPSHDMDPSISADGLTLYFCSDCPGGYGRYDLWVTTRDTIDNEWGTPMNLGPTVNSSFHETAPCISSDGLELYFSGWRLPARPGGYGMIDIWVTRRESRDDAWGLPVNLGPPINSSVYDRNAGISADGLILFFDRYSTGGQQLTWVARRPTIQDEWCSPFILGQAVHGEGEAWFPKVSADGSTLYFGSERPGGYGGGDIYQAPIIPIVDLNGDGIVDCADMCIMVDHWHTDEPSCDIGPMPWGDGIVDVQDLIVLAEHLTKEVVDPNLVAH